MLRAIPLLEFSYRPVDRFVRMAEVAGVGLIGFDHLRIGGIEDAVGSHHILETFVNLGHVAIHTPAAGAVGGVMRVRGEGHSRFELRVAVQALLVVLGRCEFPFFADAFVGFMAVHTGQGLQVAVSGALRFVAEAADAVGELGTVPGVRSVCKLRPPTGVTSAAHEVQVAGITRAQLIGRLGSGRDKRTDGEEGRQFRGGGFGARGDMLGAAVVASFATYAEVDRVGHCREILNGGPDPHDLLRGIGQKIFSLSGQLRMFPEDVLAHVELE